MAKGWNETPALMYSTVDSQNRQVTVSVNFNLSTLAIVNPGATVVRDVGCTWDVLVVGTGRVNEREFDIPVGSTNVSRQLLSAGGFATVQDVADAGITFKRSAG